MRSSVVLVIAVFSLAQSWAQTVFTPATPALTPDSPILTPGSPALSVSANNGGTVATNATLEALTASLGVLQANIQRTLPILIGFNDSFDFVGLEGPGASGTAANPPGNFAANSGVNSAANSAVNSAVPTGPPLITSVPTGTVPVPAPAPAANAPSQGFVTQPVTRDALRALLVLQSDMQRILPILNALNSGAVNAPGSFTNLFNVQASSP